MKRRLTPIEAVAVALAVAATVAALVFAAQLFLEEAAAWRIAAFLTGGACLWLWSGVRLIGWAGPSRS